MQAGGKCLGVGVLLLRLECSHGTVAGVGARLLAVDPVPRVPAGLWVLRLTGWVWRLRLWLLPLIPVAARGCSASPPRGPEGRERGQSHRLVPQVSPA